MTEEAGSLDIPLPRRLDRRMRLGPFPSARDALKFAAYAAVGTTALPVGGAAAWLPFLVAGFFLAVYRPDGKGIDERAGDYLRWRVRRRAHRGAKARASAHASASALIELPGQSVAAIVEAGGIPIRFLPPSDARELFDEYRALLRSLSIEAYVDASTIPIPLAPYRLGEAGEIGTDEAGARDGYAELVSLLLKHRRRRRVRFVLFGAAALPGTTQPLEDHVRSAMGHLAALGTHPERLVGENLRRAADEIGWATGATD